MANRAVCGPQSALLDLVSAAVDNYFVRGDRSSTGYNESSRMTAPSPEDVSLLLREAKEGREGAIEKAFALMYDELRGIAAAHFRNQPGGHTLQSTALIHEAYLRMVGADSLDVDGRAHFAALASRVMRQILVDHCRKRVTAKRGGDWVQITLDGAKAPEETHTLGVLDLDDALQKLAELDPRKSQVVELRFFGGLNVQEVARILGIAGRTVEADWAMARAWLKKELEGTSRGGE